VRLKLLAAADENGPVQSYWLVVAPLNWTRNATDLVERLEVSTARCRGPLHAPHRRSWRPAARRTWRWR